MSEQINFTTGPVKIQKEVSKMFSNEPVPHRSEECKMALKRLALKLCTATSAKDLIIMNGSGTLANEAMIAQIKREGTKGLILSNGEFGNRLIRQCEKQSLNFSVLEKEWGTCFDLKEIESLMNNDYKWILFCHGETSTGVINDLEGLSELSRSKEIALYMDCMSTVGNIKLDLSGVKIATCSSGKGLGSYPGLALVFTNEEFREDNSIPQYLDLGYYKLKENMPFTISSNQIFGLEAAIDLTMQEEHWKSLKMLSVELKEIFRNLGVKQININGHSHIFTIDTQEINSSWLGDKLKEYNVVSSYKSKYLESKNWIQIALMGLHVRSEILHLKTVFKEILNNENFCSPSHIECVNFAK